MPDAEGAMAALEAVSEEAIGLGSLVPRPALPIEPIMLDTALCVRVFGYSRAPVRGESLFDCSPLCTGRQHIASVAGFVRGASRGGDDAPG